jgi:hypothetical protein
VNANFNFRHRLPERNPFSTRATRPGALAYQFLNGHDLDSLVRQLAENQWWGEVVGPHGSGKSTLLHALQAPLRAAGRTIHLYTLHRGEKRLPIVGTDLQSWDGTTIVLVDGYEQLGGWNRTMLKRICRQQRAGLLVTAHEPAGFPPLFTTSVTVDLAQWNAN